MHKHIYTYKYPLYTQRNIHMNIHIHTYSYGCIMCKYTYGLYTHMLSHVTQKKKHIPLKCQNNHVKIWGNSKRPAQGWPNTQRCRMLWPAGPPCHPGEPAGTYPPLRVGVRPKSVQSPTDMSSELSTVTTAARARPHLDLTMSILPGGQRTHQGSLSPEPGSPGL